MKEFQKIIKYVAIAFGTYLAISIIAAIATGIIAICTGIYGVNYLTDGSQVERVDKQQEFEQFSKMKLEIASSTLTIKSEGDKYKIDTYQIPETTKIENKDGILNIKDTKKIINSTVESSITIYIPETANMEEIDLDMGAGIVNINGLKSKKAEFSFGAGNVNIKNIVSENAKIECGAGQVIIEDADLTNIKLDSGVGKLVYSGYMRGNTKIDCGIGEVRLNLAGGSEIYSIDTEKGIGDIKINGNSVANETVTGNGENRIEIDGGIGSISVDM